MPRFGLGLGLCLLLLAASPPPSSAQHRLTVAAPYQTDFTDFTAAGFAPEPSAGQLDSDLWIASPVNTRTLEFGGTSGDEDFANGPSGGGETAGGVWAFGPLPFACGGGSGTYLGVQASVRTFTPGAFQVRLTNGTGAPLTRVDVRYALAVRNDENRSLAHQVSLRRLDGTGAEVERLPLLSSDVITPEDAEGAVWEVRCINATVDLSAAGPADGRFTIAFELDDVGGSGGRDEVGFSEVWISAERIPEVDAGASLDAGVRDAGTDAGGRDAGSDAGRSDAGRSDAGAAPVDGGTTTDLDAAAPFDAGSLPPRDDGCGCSVPGFSTPSGGWFGFTLLALLARRRR
ncbi:MAG: MYXO-CTERM sorting domain-containing protein [Sandaracinaceae bacterium]